MRMLEEGIDVQTADEQMRHSNWVFSVPSHRNLASIANFPPQVTQFLMHLELWETKQDGGCLRRDSIEVLVRQLTV
jgi:hypothetical protein